MQHKRKQLTAKKQNQANGKRGILFERKKKGKISYLPVLPWCLYVWNLPLHIYEGGKGGIILLAK